MKYLVSLLILVLFLNCSRQEINWKQAKNWKLYSVRTREAFSIPADTLSYLKSTSLDSIAMQNFLAKAIPLPTDKAGVWMGAILVSCDMEGEKRKILFSTYGGFLFDEGNKRYYELPESQKEDCLSYLNESLRKLTNQ